MLGGSLGFIVSDEQHNGEFYNTVQRVKDGNIALVRVVMDYLRVALWLRGAASAG